jgi:hypothetical protein
LFDFTFYRCGNSRVPLPVAVEKITYYFPIKKARFYPGLEIVGSPARTRTADLVVNSHLLCQLSYWGSIGNFLSNKKIIASQEKFCSKIFSKPKQISNLFFTLIGISNLMIPQHIVKLVKK